MKKIIWSFLLSTAALYSTASAQLYTKPDKAIGTMPPAGRTVENFVPKGWEIVSQAVGDLNADGLPDAAITVGLNEDLRGMLDTGEDNYESPPYIVAVLFGKKGGGYERFAVNGQLYPKYGDAPLNLKIAKGVLITNQNFRDGWALDATYRFRYDPEENKLRLIGFDLEHYSRTSIYEGSKFSENYLTGLRFEYAKSSSNRKSSVYSETKKSRIAPSIIYFEEARFNEQENDDSDMVRPF